MHILAIDPGTTVSGWVLWDGFRVLHKGIDPNENMLGFLPLSCPYDCVIEQMSCYGARVGRETFEAIHWSGRIYEAWLRSFGKPPSRIERREVKKHLCGSATANDAAIWAVLVDRFGAPGTAKAPGILYKVSSHQRAALALAVTWFDRKLQEANDV